MIYLASSAGDLVKSYIAPTISSLIIIASIVCVLFLIIGGYHYMTSAGKPDNLTHAKRVIKNALIGLVIVLAAVCINSLLTHAYTTTSSGLATNVPSLNAIKPNSSSGLIDVIIKTITGVLSSVVSTVAIPFLKALTYFTSSTPLIASNPSVFNLWLATVGMADGLFVLVIILLGLHVMSFASLGLDEINIRQLLPRIGLAFLLINSSVFIIDSIISLSNLLIKAINGGQAVDNVWQTLSDILKQPSAYDLASLIIMVIFLVFSVILLIYYVGRIVTLYVGAVLAPLILLFWLLPSFRDFAMTAAKRYITTIFVLFVHVIILELAGSLLANMVNGASSHPDPLMGMIVGLATLVALLKTQGVMADLTYATVGPKMARKIGERLVLNMSYVGSQAVQTVGQLLPSKAPPSQNFIESSYNSLPSTKLTQTNVSKNQSKDSSTTRSSAASSAVAAKKNDLKPKQVNNRGHQK